MIEEIEVLYNCGLQEMEYIVSDYLNGPNYNLTVVDDNQEREDGDNKFFKFENQGLKNLFQKNFDFQGNCKLNFFFPYQKNFDKFFFDNIIDETNNPTIMICVDIE